MNILVAEDDLDDQEFIKEAFARNCIDCELEFFNNGLTLINQLKSGSTAEAPAMIVLDLNMPLMDGYQVMEALKDLPQYGNVPVVVVTASTRETEENVCRQLGCSQFYRKPLSVAEYDELVENILYGMGTA
jgi:CheY-like chemotaxis protein